MHRAATLTFALTIAALSLASTAEAKSEYVVRIPNGGLNTCENCHPGGNTMALNLFGQDTLGLMGKAPADWWPAIRANDSDGDGQTNGQELGDPCEEWLMGLTPGRTTDISNPGDGNDLSADPDNPPCDPGSSSAATTGAATTGAGTTSAATTAGAGGGEAGGAGLGGTANDSTGAGKADPPVGITPGACSVNASLDTSLESNLGGAAAFLTALALALSRSTARSRRKRAPRQK